MTTKPNLNSKTQLTDLEKVEVAYWHIVRGYPQHDLAAMYKVNAGRVAEAVVAVRKGLNIE